MTNPVLVQGHFRFRTDTGAVDATPTWPAAEDINYYPGQETNFRIRFSVSNSNTTASGPFIPRISKNGAAYAAVTASSTNGVQSNTAASSSADAAAMATANFRLTAGVGTAFAGAYDNNGSTTLSMASGVFTELEYGFIIKSANVAPGDIIDWELYNSTTAFTTYSQIPRTCIPETPGSDFAAFHILGSTGSIVANQASIALTTVKAGNAGNLAVIAVACDNNQTTDGDEGAVTSVTDSVGGNTWTKAIEFCNGQGTAQAGATVSIWYSQLTNAIPVGTVITANFSNATSRDAAAITGKVWTLAAGKTLIVAGTGTRADDGVDPGSLDVTTVNSECLRIRCTAMEYTGAVDITTAKTANWSPWQRGIGSTGTSTTSMSVYGESIITVGTGRASDPTIAAADCASAYVAFRLAGANQTLTGTKYTEAADSFGTALKVNLAITGVKYSEAADTFGVPVVGRGVRTIVGVKFSDTPDSFGVPVVRPDQRLTGTKFSDTPDSFGVPVVTQTAVSDVLIYITSGTSFSVPSDCYWAKSVEAIAGGGSGGNGTAAVGARGGGGGGAYSRINNKPTFTSPGAAVTVQIGVGALAASPAGDGLAGGDTWFVVTGLLLAKGGQGGTSSARALGGDQNAGVGDIRWSGGQGGQPSVGNWSGGGGGPGGNFNQFFGGNGNNTTGSVNSGGGGGGGVNGVGTAGSPSTGIGGSGGANRFSVSAAGGTPASRRGGNGSDGGGGGGGGSDGTTAGGDFAGYGGDGTEWDSTHGIGGGGGGGGYAGAGNSGGFYGGGGGGGGYFPGFNTSAGTGGDGIIRFVYTPGSLIATKGLIATRFTNTNRIYYPTTSGGAEVRVYIYSTASFTVPGDCPVAEKIRAIGGGGGGGRGGSIAGGAGDGGGGGAYAEGQNVSLTPGAVLTVNLGVGGSTGIPASAGGNTYFGGTDLASSLVFAEGGKGGGFGSGASAGLAANSKGTVKNGGGNGGPCSSSGKWSGGGGGAGGGFTGVGRAGGWGGFIGDNSTQGGGGGGGCGSPGVDGKNSSVGGDGGTNFRLRGNGLGGTSGSINGTDGTEGGGGGGSGSDGSTVGHAGKGGDGIELGGYGIGGAAGGSGGGGGGGGPACTGGDGGLAGGGGGGSGFTSSGNPIGGDGGFGYLSLVYVPTVVAQSLTAKRYVHEYNYLIGAEPGNTSELDSAGGVTVQTTIKHSGSYAFKSAGAVATPASIKLP